ncbi:MAG: BMP family protein [Deltaproteobacteria bacterium]|jgi:basic membrane lipoprotein Med (substrate-binding protein (PBP1-ABC) superfamily)|nr:BMP family protein [Deltaproteobacteria bacterium]
MSWSKKTIFSIIWILAAVWIMGVSPLNAKPKVAAIYTLPVEQQWISRIHKALNASMARGDIEYVFSESVKNTDYERVMREYAEKGMDLLVGEVFGVERAARKVAKDYPGTAFLMGSSFGPSGQNFSVFDNWIHEPSYLTGMIAGAMTKTNKMGIVGGYPIPEVNRLVHAFMDGVHEVNPDVKFMVTFLGSWFDPPKAKESAFAQIERGADILFAERFGVSDAAKEKGVLAIGNVIDTQSDYPDTVIASAIWNMEATIDRAVSKVASGSFEGEDYGQYSFMKYGGGSLAPYGTFENRIPAKVKKLVAERSQEIKDGLFRVNVNDAEPKSTM